MRRRHRKLFFLYSPGSLVSRDWRPEPGDVSRADLRAIASLGIGEVCYLGGGAFGMFVVHRVY